MREKERKGEGEERKKRKGRKEGRKRERKEGGKEGEGKGREEESERTPVVSESEISGQLHNFHRASISKRKKNWIFYPNQNNIHFLHYSRILGK